MQRRECCKNAECLGNALLSVRWTSSDLSLHVYHRLCRSALVLISYLPMSHRSTDLLRDHVAPQTMRQADGESSGRNLNQHAPDLVSWNINNEFIYM